ncbi:MAG: hypothetical protein IJU10_03845 [Clostridia bacterium]|nr:hypothetical protein [Clostridia bacterium]
MELKDRVEIASLLTEYGALLTEKQREMLKMYTELDMSLFEVAEEYGVTRQAVRDAVRHAVSTLQNYEDKVRKIALKRDLTAALDALPEADRERLQGLYDILEG